MRVAVIGGAGRMGRWLVEYFLSRGHEVVLSDVRRNDAKAIAKLTGASLVWDNSEAVGDADLAVVSTPIEVTPKVLKEVAPGLRQSSTLMEISSLKSQVIPVMRKIARRGMRTLSIHPLFGPGVQKLAEERVALIPVSEAALEFESARGLFPDVEIVVVDVEEHDRAMALTLSLPHFLNIVFASVISKEDFNVLKKLSGTTFRLQLALSEAVMSEDPELYASIQIGNRYTTEYLGKFMLRAEALMKQVTEKDAKGFSQLYMDVRSSLARDSDFAKAYERMYRVWEALRDDSPASV